DYYCCSYTTNTILLF
nr:immunoglobulin light chain junction region [Macaca mulatta]MOX30843.1 immunoglobulin light chain junction region [Macaca mulatta]